MTLRLESPPWAEFSSAVIVTTRCERCPDWSFYGSVGQGHEEFEAHRLEFHPDIQPRPRRRMRFVEPSAPVATL
jgi:hypothetical protein